jgi:hypothetical protein
MLSFGPPLLRYYYLFLAVAASVTLSLSSAEIHFDFNDSATCDLQWCRIAKTVLPISFHPSLFLWSLKHAISANIKWFHPILSSEGATSILP